MLASEFVQLVRDRLNVALAEDPALRLADLADDLGYRADTLQKFRSGAMPSVRVAAALARLLPGMPGACPHCGAPPPLRFRDPEQAPPRRRRPTW